MGQKQEANVARIVDLIMKQDRDLSRRAVTRYVRAQDEISDMTPEEADDYARWLSSQMTLNAFPNVIQQDHLLMFGSVSLIKWVFLISIPLAIFSDSLIWWGVLTSLDVIGFAALHHFAHFASRNERYHDGLWGVWLRGGLNGWIAGAVAPEGAIYGARKLQNSEQQASFALGFDLMRAMKSGDDEGVEKMIRRLGEDMPEIKGILEMLNNVNATSADAPLPAAQDADAEDEPKASRKMRRRRLKSRGGEAGAGGGLPADVMAAFEGSAGDAAPSTGDAPAPEGPQGDDEEGISYEDKDIHIVLTRPGFMVHHRSEWQNPIIAKHCAPRKQTLRATWEPFNINDADQIIGKRVKVWVRNAPSVPLKSLLTLLLRAGNTVDVENIPESWKWFQDSSRGVADQNGVDPKDVFGGFSIERELPPGSIWNASVLNSWLAEPGRAKAEDVREDNETREMTEEEKRSYEDYRARQDQVVHDVLQRMGQQLDALPENATEDEVEGAISEFTGLLGVNSASDLLSACGVKSEADLLAAFGRAAGVSFNKSLSEIGVKLNDDQLSDMGHKLSDLLGTLENPGSVTFGIDERQMEATLQKAQEILEAKERGEAVDPAAAAATVENIFGSIMGIFGVKLNDAQRAEMIKTCEEKIKKGGQDDA